MGLRGRGERVLHAYNYASVGVDAQVALDFHRARAQFLYRFANRTLNYVSSAAALRTNTTECRIK